MSLDDAFKNILSKRSAPRASIYCAYKILYDSLDPQDQKTLDDAWAKNYPVNLIVQALRADGHKASSDSVRLHRNGTCRCPKE